MALTSHAPLSIHHEDRYHSSSIPYPPPPSHEEERNMSYGTSSHQNAYYGRPPGSSHGQNHSNSNPGSSPERLHSSSGGYNQHPPGSSSGNPPAHSSPNHSLYQSGTHDGPPGSSHGYSQSPITPLNTSAQPPYQQPHSSGFYGLSTPTESHVPSPPPSSGGRPQTAAVAQFTSDGNPIVPVGISGGKMFQCRGYGDCDKVFTRSEHLARHVRKHTGERPFPCHCGKAFSRLDNLRQHAATVHADQGGLNDAMLNSLAPVHAALSQRANRDQRKRGEVVEVPKNAVERPRHNDGRKPQTPHDFAGYPDQWDPNARPRTGGGYDYPYPPVPADGSGPSRRPGSGGYSYPPYYEGGPRPPTAPGTASSEDSMPQLPYPYRPMSSSGRELPVPSHYAESEPPSSAHGPPQSPMYPAPVPPHGEWSSPPAHSGYHQPGMYPPPPPGNYNYEHSHGYGPPPPGSAGSNYNYPPGSAGGQYYSYPPAPHAPGPTQSPSYGASHTGDSPFHYHAGDGHGGEYSYGYDRKRRAEDEHGEGGRKQPRPASAAAPRPGSAHGEGEHAGGEDPLWLPPATERRSSLAISALLGSPQQNPRSRPATADIPEQQYQSFSYGDGPSTNSSSLPATPVQGGVNGTPGSRSREAKAEHGVGGIMEDKAKALLSAGGQR